MPPAHPPDQSPDASPASPSRSRSTVPFVLAAMVFVVSLIVTYSVSANLARTALTDLEDDFNYRARDFSASIVRRMAVYEEVLQATRGFVRGSVDIDQAAFAEYFGLLRLDEQFPGIQALAIAAIVPPERLAAHQASMRAQGFPHYAITPPGPRGIYTAVTHIQPLRGANLRALGFDMLTEPQRRAAMEAARDTGRAAASGRVTLVQEGARGGEAGGEPGFLMYVPVYRAGQPHATRDERRAAIVGWIGAPFRVSDLMRGLGGEHASDLEVELRDSTTPGEAALLYRSPGTPTPGHRPRFTYRSTVDTGGRSWTMAIRSSPTFEAGLANRPLLAIWLTGAGLGLALALIVWLLASERRWALQLAGDMTVELRESHDRIDAERERMRLILQNAYDAFIAIDPRGRITDWNVQAFRIFGWRDTEVIGQDALELLGPPARRAAWRASLQRFARDGQCPLLAGPTETTVMTRLGQEIPVEIALTAMETADGHGMTAFLRDIRPRKEAEERERLRQQRLDEARGALLRSQKLEAVGKLTGGVAHDFNNILHIISANVQLMLRNEEAGSRKRLLSILDAVERGRKLSAQLLAFARRQPLHPSVVNLAELIERMDTLLHRATGDSIAIRFDIQPGLWNALVDPNQLENVLLNLVINARDAMDGAGSVTIALSNLTVEPGSILVETGIRPGEFVSLAVIDTGSGMPPDVIEHAFEPFFTTKPEGKGTGLGLSMAHGFVKQSGGHIRLASQPGEGTTVTIYLPRALQETPDPAFAPVLH
jgi:PAS domain S-box-containing protein